MKISEQGFTERLPAQTNRAGSISDATSGSFSKVAGRQTSSDSLQLSNLASRLQNTSSIDAGRAGRLSQIASAVQSNTFKIDPAQISRAMVSEAVQNKAA